MRISTSAIYDANVRILNQQQSKLLATQQQLASGRRILKPSDDPIASARALEVSQSDAVNTQYATNRNSLKSSAALSESILQSVTSLLQDVKTLAVQAGAGTLNASDKQTIATALSGRLEELKSLANSTDGLGNFLYSGYQGRAQPFSNSATGVNYDADDGQRMIQVSSSRQMAASDSGADIFMRIKSGNGTFATEAATANTGSGIVSQGTVTSSFNGNSYQVTFTSANLYDVINTTSATAAAAATAAAITPAEIAAAAAATTAATVSTGNTYASGQTISFAGIQFDISGTPSGGDNFTVAPSQNESIFKTISDLITAMGTPAATFSNGLSKALNKLDRDLDNVLTVRASLGSRLAEIDALDATGEDLGVNFKATLSQLQDLDYNKGISDLNQQQLVLTAAQKTFKQISDLSLFNYI